MILFLGDVISMNYCHDCTFHLSVHSEIYLLNTMNYMMMLNGRYIMFVTL